LSVLDEQGKLTDVDYSNAKKCSLFGMTCDGRDIIASSMLIPDNLAVGDWLCFDGMGSYTVGPVTEFNGMKAISRVCVWD